MTAVRPPARFGGLEVKDQKVTRFTEKSQVDQGWINGGFMVFQPEIIDYIRDDNTVLEHEPLEGLATEGQLSAFYHEGFWQCVDTLRELTYLRQLWSTDAPPWKNW